jgi:hypothetical protein
LDLLFKASEDERSDICESFVRKWFCPKENYRVKNVEDRPGANNSITPIFPSARGLAQKRFTILKNDKGRPRAKQ